MHGEVGPMPDTGTTKITHHHLRIPVCLSSMTQTTVSVTELGHRLFQHDFRFCPKHEGHFSGLLKGLENYYLSST
jgi:hypothetical protein